MSIEDLTKLITTATALVAVIVGPLLSWRIAKRQAADNISAKRQNWIDELRKDCAAFLQLSAKLEELRRPHPESSPEDRKRTFDERAETNAKASELFNRIRLRLNPNEADHNKLFELFVGLAAMCKTRRPEKLMMTEENPQWRSTNRPIGLLATYRRSSKKSGSV